MVFWLIINQISNENLSYAIHSLYGFIHDLYGFLPRKGMISTGWYPQEQDDIHGMISTE
jgi:hypothetical protein